MGGTMIRIWYDTCMIRKYMSSKIWGGLPHRKFFPSVISFEPNHLVLSILGLGQRI